MANCSLLAVTVTHITRVTSENLSFLDLIKILIPVMIFFSGIGFNRLLEKIKERNRLDDLEEYFTTICRLINVAANRQVSALLTTAKTIKHFRGKNFMIPEIPAFNLDEFSAINKTDLYKIFVRNRKGDISDNTLLFHNLLNCVHFYQSSIKLITRNDEENLKLVAKFREVWNSNQTYAMNEINTMMLQSEINGVKPGQDAFLDSLQTIIKQRKALQKNTLEEPSIDNMHSEFVTPMINILLEHKNERSIKLLPYYSSMHNEFINLRKFRLAKSSFLAKLARSLQHTRMDLKKILESYKAIGKK